MINGKPSKRVPPRSLQALTLCALMMALIGATMTGCGESADSIRDAAYDSGYDDGYNDGVLEVCRQVEDTAPNVETYIPLCR